MLFHPAMRLLPLLLLALARSVVASSQCPALPPPLLQSRQTWTDSWYESEFFKYGCRPIIFVFAKATIEPGNIGNTVGPRISNALKSAFGVVNVATEGVDYLGLPGTNFMPGGAPPWGIFDMQYILTAAARCPNSKIVAAGYRAVEGVPQHVKDRIAGVVTFGDTQTMQDGGRIINFPLNKTLIICNVGDIICIGTLYVVPVHLDYIKWVPTAVAWLIGRLLAADEEDPWWPGTFNNIPPAPPPAPPLWPTTGRGTGTVMTSVVATSSHERSTMTEPFTLTRPTTITVLPPPSSISTPRSSTPSLSS